jgi:hypothetical protein
MKKKAGGDSRESGGAFMSDTNNQRIEFSVEHDRVATTLNIIKNRIPYLV